MKEAKKEKLDSLCEDLGNALARLEEALALEPSRINKDGTIQRFEFCFELSWKLMKSFAEYKGLEVRSPRDAVRLAAQLGVLDNPRIWLKKYLESRNIASHTYNEEMADEVYNTARKFLKDAKKLLKEVCSELT